MSTEPVSSEATPQASLYAYYTSDDKKPLSSLSDAEAVIASITKILKSSAAEAALPSLIEGPGFSLEQGWATTLEPPPQPSIGLINKYKKAVDALDLSNLQVNSKVLDEYASAEEGTYKQHRLLEIICTAIHHLAIDLYTTHNPPPDKVNVESFIPPPYPVVAHSQYYASKPWKSIFDLKAVGFWAEALIFGGVIYFDRGSTSEYKGIWLHGLPNAYTESLWHVPDEVVEKGLDGSALPFDIEAAKNPDALLGLQEAQEHNSIYRDPSLANADAYTGEHVDETMGLSDEDLAEIQALQKKA